MRNIEITQEVIFNLKEVSKIEGDFITFVYMNGKVIIANEGIRSLAAISDARSFMFKEDEKIVIRVEKQILTQIIKEGYMTVETILNEDKKVSVITIYEDKELQNKILSSQIPESYTTAIDTLLGILNSVNKTPMQMDTSVFRKSISNIIEENNLELNIDGNYIYGIGSDISIYQILKNRVDLTVGIDQKTYKLLTNNLREYSQFFKNENNVIIMKNGPLLYFVRTVYLQEDDVNYKLNMEPMSTYMINIDTDIPFMFSKKFISSSKDKNYKVDLIDNMISLDTNEVKSNKRIKSKKISGVDVKSIEISVDKLKYLCTLSPSGIVVKIYKKFIRVELEGNLICDIGCIVYV